MAKLSFVINVGKTKWETGRPKAAEHLSAISTRLVFIITALLITEL